MLAARYRDSAVAGGAITAAVGRTTHNSVPSAPSGATQRSPCGPVGKPAQEHYEAPNVDPASSVSAIANAPSTLP